MLDPFSGFPLEADEVRKAEVRRLFDMLRGGARPGIIARILNWLGLV